MSVPKAKGPAPAQQPLLSSVSVNTASADSSTAPPEFHQAMRWSIVTAKVTAAIEHRQSFLLGAGFVFFTAVLFYAVNAITLYPQTELANQILSQCSPVRGGADPQDACIAQQVVVADQRYQCPASVTIPSTNLAHSIRQVMLQGIRMVFPMVFPWILGNMWRYGRKYNVLSDLLMPTTESVSLITTLSVPILTLMLGAMSYISTDTNCLVVQPSQNQSGFILYICIAAVMLIHTVTYAALFSILLIACCKELKGVNLFSFSGYSKVQFTSTLARVRCSLSTTRESSTKLSHPNSFARPT
jgi:hypothetical protein